MIDVDVFYKLTRGIYKPNADIYTIGFSTHKLKPLLSSAVFSPPARLMQMDAGGSIGNQVSDVASWGDVGDVDRTQSTRTFYRKQHCICPVCDDPELKLRNLWGEFRLHRVKRPVVRHIYIERHGIYTLWRYNYTPTKHIAGLKRLEEWSVNEDYESAFTFDIIAASKIPLDVEDIRDAIRYAHDKNFLYNYVRRVLLTAHSEPTPLVRREWREVPRVVVRALPVTMWAKPTLTP